MTQRVTPVAEGLGAESLRTWAGSTASLKAEWNEASIEWRNLERDFGKGKIPIEKQLAGKSFALNVKWVEHLNAERYTVLNLGGDPGSVFYDMEVRGVHGK